MKSPLISSGSYHCPKVHCNHYGVENLAIIKIQSLCNDHVWLVTLNILDIAVTDSRGL